MTEGAGPPPPPDPASKPGKVASAKAGMTRAQVAAQARFEQLQAARETNHMVDAGFHFYERDLGAGGGVLAGAVAFRLFIFAVPYVFVVLTLFGSAAELQNESGQDAARSAGLTGLIAKSVADAERTTDSTKIISILVGLFAVVLAARTVVKTLRAVHALAWRVPLTRLKHSTRAAVFLILVVLGVSLVVSLIGWVRSERPAIGLVLGLALIVVWSGAWLIVSWLLPHAKDVTWLDLVPGSLLFGLIIWLMHLLTVFYFSRKMASASETYGAIGAAIGILLALYLVGRAMSASAVLNATLWERKQAREQTPAGVTDAREMLGGFLDWFRAVAERKLHDLTLEQTTEVTMPSGTTMLGIVQHLRWDEHWWFRHHLLGDPPGADTDESFAIAPDATVDSVVAGYRAACAISRETIQDLPLDTVCAVPHPVFGPVDLEWILVHMIEETARHCGHLDILRELTDGRTG